MSEYLEHLQKIIKARKRQQLYKDYLEKKNKESTKSDPKLSEEQRQTLV